MFSILKLLTVAAFVAPAIAQSGCGVEILDSENPSNLVIGSGCVPPGGQAKVYVDRRKATYTILATADCGLSFLPGTGPGATLRSSGRAGC